MLNNTIKILRKRIKALQQENNGWQKRYYELDAGHSKLFKDFCKLQTQMTQIKKAVQKLKETVHAWDKTTWFECTRCGSIHDTLTTITKIIGGAEDGSSKDK